MRDSGMPKSRFAESLKKIGNSLLNLFRGDFPVFLLFLAISFFFWWSRTMSSNYETTLKVPVKVVGVPDNVRMLTPADEYLTVSIGGKGTALLKSGRAKNRRTVSVNNSRFNMNQGRASLSTLILRDSVASMLPPSVVIRSIQPDSLTYTYALQHVLKVPVVYDGNIESADQFYMERIEFTPDSVQAMVLVADSTVRSAYVSVDGLLLNADTLVLEASIKPVNDVQFTPAEVRMTVLSQQYTEKSLEVPVKGVNFPDGVVLKSFPSRAVVTFWVKLSEYDRVDEQDFTVVVDYNDIAGRDVSKAELRIFSQPANVRNVRLQVRSVDYLIEVNHF